MSDLTAPRTPAGAADELTEQIAGYRHARQQIERGILPLATSLDGLSFELQASLHDLRLERGGYVRLESERWSGLGQITDLVVESRTAAAAGAAGGVLVRLARGTGIVLDGDGTPFHDASVRPADSAEVASWLQAQRPHRAGLTVGELLRAPGVPATLDSGGLDRHTFMCGQSGSGKTYSLGLLLERVLAETSLRVVVLDPNSDYVGLGRPRPDADPALAERYADVPREVSVWRNHPDAEHPLHLRFADLDPQAQAAVLGLDPIGDREEYAVLAELLRLQRDGRPLIASVDQLLESEIPGARQLGQRALNLGILDWGLWHPEAPSLVAELQQPSTRCTVVDIGSLGTPQEQRTVAEAVLSTLWANRLSRTPCLLVVDEAHNVCPAEPTDELTRLSTERAVQIAAEGRKYGLYLLTSTQRPHKVHENVVSQSDNLLLMRMNSRADLADLARIFSFVPEGLMAGASAFRMGHALVAGKLLPQPAYVRMGERVSEEGGADIPTTWATPRT
ncbi:MAG TPA: ATP-binding protein [Nocardioidaceae bacterium]